MNVLIKTSDGFALDGEFTKVKNSTKGIIFLHGMTVAKDDEGIFVGAEPKLNKLGFSTLRFDFRAHGKSSGNSISDFTISGEIEDLKTVVAFVQRHGIKQIGFAAASFGGSIASFYIKENPSIVKALFLANPVLNYEKGFLHPRTLWAMKYFANLYSKLNRRGFIEVGSRRFNIGQPLFDEMKIYNPCQALKAYEEPLMVVHGDKDNKVDYRQTAECFNNLPNSQKEFKLISGANHGFHTEPYCSEVTDILVKFFEEKM